MELTYTGRSRLQARRTLTHIYLFPHPALAPYVAHYTFCLAGSPPASGPDRLTLIPDASGCLVFTLTPQGLEGLLFGPSSRTASVDNDLGICPMRFFVEFRPGGLQALTGLPQRALADRVLPLADALPCLDRTVQELFDRAQDLDGFALAVDRFLLQACPAPSPLLPMLDFLARSTAPAPLQALADHTGYSPRHLSRLLGDGVGMGARSFVRVLRVNAAVRRLQAGPCSLTRLAQELGYYDQAHFIHDFKGVTGVPPTAYQTSLSDFYNEPLKF